MPSDMRERMIQLICCSGRNYDNYVEEQHKMGMPVYEDFESWLVDDLIAYGVILPPCKVGDTAYFLIEDDFPVHKWYLSEEKITEVCSKGFFTSAFVQPEEDFGNFTPYKQLGTEAFLDKEEAGRVLSGRCDT